MASYKNTGTKDNPKYELRGSKMNTRTKLDDSKQKKAEEASKQGAGAAQSAKTMKADKGE